MVRQNPKSTTLPSQHRLTCITVVEADKGKKPWYNYSVQLNTQYYPQVKVSIRLLLPWSDGPFIAELHVLRAADNSYRQVEMMNFRKLTHVHPNSRKVLRPLVYFGDARLPNLLSILILSYSSRRSWTVNKGDSDVARATWQLRSIYAYPAAGEERLHTHGAVRYTGYLEISPSSLWATRVTGHCSTDHKTGQSHMYVTADTSKMAQ